VGSKEKKQFNDNFFKNKNDIPALFKLVGLDPPADVAVAKAPVIVPTPPVEEKKAEALKPAHPEEKIPAFQQAADGQRGSFLSETARFGRLPEPPPEEKIQRSFANEQWIEFTRDLANDHFKNDDAIRAVYIAALVEYLSSGICGYEECRKFFDLIKTEQDNSKDFMLYLNSNDLNSENTSLLFLNYAEHLYTTFSYFSQLKEFPGYENLSTAELYAIVRKLYIQHSLGGFDRIDPPARERIAGFFSQKARTIEALNTLLDRAELDKKHQLQEANEREEKNPHPSLDKAVKRGGDIWKDAWLQDNEIFENLREIIQFEEYLPGTLYSVGVGDGFVITEGAQNNTYEGILKKALDAAKAFGLKEGDSIYIPFTTGGHWTVKKIKYSPELVPENVPYTEINSYADSVVDGRIRHIRQSDEKTCGDWSCSFIVDEVTAHGTKNMRDADVAKRISDIERRDPGETDKRQNGEDLRKITHEVFTRRVDWVNKIFHESKISDVSTQEILTNSLGLLYRNHFRELSKHENNIILIAMQQKDPNDIKNDLIKYRNYMRARSDIENAEIGANDKRFLLDALILRCLKDKEFPDVIKNIFLKNDRGFFNLFDPSALNIEKIDSRFFDENKNSALKKLWQAADLLYRSCPDTLFTADHQKIVASLVAADIQNPENPSPDDIDKIRNIIVGAELKPVFAQARKPAEAKTPLQTPVPVPIPSSPKKPALSSSPLPLSGTLRVPADIGIMDFLSQKRLDSLSKTDTALQEFRTTINNTKNRVVSCSHEFIQVDRNQKDATLAHYLGRNYVKLATFQSDELIVKQNEPGKIDIHVSQFDITTKSGSAGGSATSKQPTATIVAVDEMVPKDGKQVRQTTLYGNPVQLANLKDTENNAELLLMAAIHISNYMLKRPEPKRNDPIRIADIHPDTPPMLLAMMLVYADKVGVPLNIDYPPAPSDLQKHTTDKLKTAETFYDEIIAKGQPAPDDKTAAAEFLGKFGSGLH